MYYNCGNDYLGKISLDSLSRIGIDTTSINILKMPTNLFHINISNGKVITKKKCPICGNKTWNNPEIKLNITKNAIIIIDSLQYLHYLENKIVMVDIGYSNELEKLNSKDIEYFFKFPFEIINMNNRVAEFLTDKLKLQTLKELYQLLNTKLMIITKGKDGVTYLCKDEQFDFKLSKIEEEIDSDGAGDMFFASTIKDYIRNSLVVNDNFIKNSFKNASTLSKEVVKVVGARSYYQKLYKHSKITNNCYCHRNFN